MEFEKIDLSRAKNKMGATILKKRYDQMFELIISKLKSNTNREVALTELVEYAQINLSSHFGADIPWCLLQVKKHMEVKGIIKTSLNMYREQYIQLNRRFKI